MQGHLLQKNLTCSVESRCASSGRAIAFEVESDHPYRIRSLPDRALVLIPLIDLGALDAPSIVDDF